MGFGLLSRLLPYIVGSIAIIGVIGGIYYFGYTSGAEAKDKEYQVVIKEERERLENINEQTLKAARSKELFLRAQIGKTNAKISQLLKEATADTDANRIAIGTSSVRRINSVGGTTEVK